MTAKETPDGTPHGGDPQATPTGPHVPPTPPTTREEIPKFYAGGKALSKSEVVVTYKDHLAAMASATKEREEAVTKARDQEAKLWFETWYSHYIAPEKPLPGEFGKFATERIQMTGYQRDHTLTPPEKTTSDKPGV